MDNCLKNTLVRGKRKKQFGLTHYYNGSVIKNSFSFQQFLLANVVLSNNSIFDIVFMFNSLFFLDCFCYLLLYIFLKLFVEPTYLGLEDEPLAESQHTNGEADSEEEVVSPLPPVPHGP